MESGRVILSDTNVIIEAVRVGCWNGLRRHYSLVTVEKCREEAWSGDRRRAGYVDVSRDDLTSGIEVIHITDKERVRLMLECPDANGLDDGERDLFAHALTREDDFLITCADQAAVKVACQLGWGEGLISLEELIRSAGLRPKFPLKDHYTTRVLGVWRARFLLE